MGPGTRPPRRAHTTTTTPIISAVVAGPIAWNDGDAHSAMYCWLVPRVVKGRARVPAPPGSARPPRRFRPGPPAGAPGVLVRKPRLEQQTTDHRQTHHRAEEPHAVRARPDPPEREQPPAGPEVARRSEPRVHGDREEEEADQVRARAEADRGAHQCSELWPVRTEAPAHPPAGEEDRGRRAGARPAPSNQTTAGSPHQPSTWLANTSGSHWVAIQGRSANGERLPGSRGDQPPGTPRRAAGATRCPGRGRMRGLRADSGRR